MTCIFRSLGLIIFCLFTLNAFSLHGQESPWSSLLEEADKGERTIEKIAAEQTAEVTISSKSDIAAITNWLLQIEPEQLPENPTQIETLDFVLGHIIQWEYSEHPDVNASRLQSQLEYQLREILTFPKDKLAPLEKTAMRILQILALGKSSLHDSLFLDAALNEQLKYSELWPAAFVSLPEDSSIIDQLQNHVSQGTIQGTLAVALVEQANDLAYDRENPSHFLSSSAGEELIRAWLSPELVEEMKSQKAPKMAAISLAFVDLDAWQELVQIARTHPDSTVALEGAWAGARRKDEESIGRLVELAKDVRTSRTAVEYLTELELNDRIPAETKDAVFAAKAELAEWLSYPTEKGRPPDELEIVETRKLQWPLEDDPVDVYLIRFTYKDPTGSKPDEKDIGFVGPMTFCHFDMKMLARSAEDIYAIHVYRELEAYDLIESVNLAEEPKAYDYLLRTWKGNALEDAKIIYVSKLDRSVGYPRRLLALASAKINGEEGFVVLDGPRSKWYSLKERVADSPESAILMIHLGRQLLNF